GRGRRRLVLQEAQLGQPPSELLDAVAGQIDAVGRGRPFDHRLHRLPVELQRQLVLEIVEAEIRAGLRIGHVDAGDTVGFGGGCFQILAESGAGVVHPGPSLQVTLKPWKGSRWATYSAPGKWKGGRQRRAPSFIAGEACASPAP